MNAKKLRSAFKQLGLTQAEAAKRLGVTERTVRYWLAGRPIPLMVTLALPAIAERLYRERWIKQMAGDDKKPGQTYIR